MNVLLILLGYLSSLNTPSTLPPNPIKEKVMAIVKELHQVNGNFIYGEEPQVIINENKGIGAAYNPDKHIITIDLALYNLCQSFESEADDALAVVLGHELAHCYMAHRTFSEFNKYDKCTDCTIEKEAAADIAGLFNTYVAGYNSFELMPEVIDSIYDLYELDDQLRGYPSREERMKLAKKVQTQVQELIEIYEAANYLLAIGQYELAALSYEHILQQYKGREIHNNIGVAYTLEALNFTPTNNDLYLYPIEVDQDIRIKKPKNSKGEGDLSLEDKYYREACLRKAKIHFDKAAQMDSSYLTADVNSITVLTLLGDYKGALSYYDTLQERKKGQIATLKKSESLQLAVAIAKAHITSLKKMQDEAIKQFTSLAKSNTAQIAYQADYNLKILEEGSCGIPEDGTCTNIVEIPSMVDNIRIHRFDSDRAHIELPSNFATITMTIDKRQNSTVYQYYEEGGAIFTFQQIAASSNLSEPLLTNSEQFNIINTTKGYFLKCIENRTVFLFTSTNELKSWGKYYSHLSN